MENKKKRLLIMDGNALVHRSYHALPPLTTKKGELINAIYGFLLVFFKTIKELQPDFIAATFDLPFPTFRHQKFKAYKATRPKTPEELYQQIPKLKEILQAFNIPIFEKKGFEADDLIGAIAKLARQKQAFPKVETIILTGDLDTLQLINPQTKVSTFKKGIKESILYDEEKVRERYQGLTPKQLPDFKALKGDPSDNIPGVPGVGEKTAITLLKEFGSLENLYQYIEQIKIPRKPASKKEEFRVNPRLLAVLKDYKEQAFFSKMLATIQKDVPIEFKLEGCRWQDYDRKKAKQILKNLEFHSLLSRLPLSETERSLSEKHSAKKKISGDKIRREMKLW